ncbi:hypothetical protein T484DRAFT_1779471, partial [Baffinella frigidus]
MGGKKRAMSGQKACRGSAHEGIVKNVARLAHVAGGKSAEEENLAAKKDKEFWVRRAMTKKALSAITLVALITNVVTSVVGLCDKVDDVRDVQFSFSDGCTPWQKTVSALDKELCAASLLIIQDYNAGQRSQTLGSEIGIVHASEGL